MIEEKSLNRKDLLEIGIKSEIESQKVYNSLNERKLPKTIKKQLKFLKEEEEGHEETLRGIFQELYPNKEPKLPEEVITPVPKINFDESKTVSDLLKEAMKSEEDSEEFYKELSKKFKEGSKEHKMLNYLSHMEKNHYEIIKNQLNSVKSFGSFKNFLNSVGSGRGL